LLSFLRISTHFQRRSSLGGLARLSRAGRVRAGSQADGEFPPSTVGTVTRFQIAAAGTRVLHAVGDASSSAPFELHSVPIEGGSAVLLGTNVRSFVLDPTGTRAVFRAGTSAVELFSVPVDGGVPARLSGVLPPARSVDAVLLDPTGARAVYLVRSFGLYSAPTDGSAAAVHVSAGLTPVSFDSLPDFFLASRERVLFLVATPEGLPVLRR
jgi:hypothetical protein